MGKEFEMGKEVKMGKDLHLNQLKLLPLTIPSSFNGKFFFNKIDFF